MSHRTVHIPEDDEPDTADDVHVCKPKDALDRDPKAIAVKHRTIVECKDCGQYWWSNVYSRYNSYSGRRLYHLEWQRLRWYHYRLQKFVR